MRLLVATASERAGSGGVEAFVLELGGATPGDPLAGLLLARVSIRDPGAIEVVAELAELGPALVECSSAALGIGVPASLLALERLALILQGLARALLQSLDQLGLGRAGPFLLEHGRALTLLESLDQLGLGGPDLLLLEHRVAQPLLELLAQLGLGRAGLLLGLAGRLLALLEALAQLGLGLAKFDRQRDLKLASAQLGVLLGLAVAPFDRGSTRERATVEQVRAGLALALGLGLLMSVEQRVGLGAAPTIAQPQVELRGATMQPTASPHRSRHSTGARSQITTLAVPLLLAQLGDALLLLALDRLPRSLFAVPGSSLGDPTVLGVDLDREAALLAIDLGVGLGLAGQLIELATQAVILAQRLLELRRQHALLEQTLERRRLLGPTLGQQRSELGRDQRARLASERRPGLARRRRRRRLARLEHHGRLGLDEILPASITSH
jgi:hypothetical protein